RITVAGRTEQFETVVIGGGQAGLSVGYHLAKRGRTFMILDANERIGGSWRTRCWDSLRLFTPAGHDGLPDRPFPAPAWSFPTAYQLADYLEDYAKRYELPIRTGVHVDGLSREGDHYLVTAGELCFEAEHIVIATGYHRTPTIPEFAGELGPDIVQMHS